MKLIEKFGDRVKQGELLSRHTTYRLGGPADFYLTVKDENEAKSAIMAAKGDGLPVFFLGGGSNLLVSDAGWRGLVLSYAGRETKAEGTRLTCGAGAILYAAVRSAMDAGLAGLEWAAGIPGTVGGAVCGNSGAYGGETGDRIVSVRAISAETGEAREFSREECRFAYRDSAFKGSPWLIVQAVFALEPGDREAMLARSSEIVETRKRKLPLELPNSGSVFRSYFFRAPSEIPAALREGMPPEFMGYGRIPAAWIFERLGLKGKRAGGAEISPKHANFFVNAGDATAAEVRELIDYAKMETKKTYGIDLVEEIRLVGFS